MASLTRTALQRATTLLNSTISPAQSNLLPRPLRLQSLQTTLQQSRRTFANGRDKSGTKNNNSPESTSSSSRDNGSPKANSNVNAESEAANLSPPAPRPPLSLKRERQAFASLDFAPAELETVGQGAANKLLTDGSSSAAGVERKHRTGARSAKDSLSSIERKRRRLGWVSGIGLVGAIIGGWVWLGWEEGDGNERGVWAWVARSNKNALKLTDLFDKPIWEKLLPDPLPEPYSHHYTLLLSIDDLLVTSTWDRQHGWRTAKRPGVDYFLAYLSQFYEIVIFTTQASHTAYPVIDALDPYSFYTQYYLFREATKTHNGTLVKDLSYLNRDLSKVIAIDTLPERYQLNPDNLIEVGKWKPGKKGPGEKADGDGGLVALIPFLESLVIFGVPDTRQVLSRYRGKDVPIEWAKVEAENKARHIKEWEAKQAQLGGLAAGGWTMGRITGTAPKTPTIPLTHLEQKRLEAQRNYMAERQYLEQNREELERQKKEMQEEGMKAMMEGGMFSVLARMGSAPAPALPPPVDSKEAGPTQMPTPAAAAVGGTEKK